MLKTQIGSVIKQAFTTFSCKPELFFQNLEILKSLLENTTANDVNLHPQFLSDNLWQRPNKAPVTFVDIFDDDKFTVGIFILKPGMKLPLHNHPEMYGLIKIIQGKVKITSYSIKTDKTNEVDLKSFQGSSVPLSFFNKQKTIVTAERDTQEMVDVNSDCCVVEPHKGNLHEIESVDGPAAFIDILAPPYESIIPNVGPRKCIYYSVLSQVTSNVFKLQEISSPSWYWTDSSPYTGPDLSAHVIS